MLLATYYAQNYAGIIGWSLFIALSTTIGHTQNSSCQQLEEIQAGMGKFFTSNRTKQET